MIQKVIDSVSGFKTYIIVAIVLAAVLVEKGLGFDVPGFDPGDDWLAFVLTALGLGTLRSGIAKKPA